jgi:hypothetical protein
MQAIHHMFSNMSQAPNPRSPADAAHPGRPLILHDLWPWIVFALGAFMVPAVFAIACFSSHPPNNWDTSFFGRRLAWPLMIFGFCCCVASPFFTRLPLWTRLVLALVGALTAALIWLISMVVLWFAFPPLV